MPDPASDNPLLDPSPFPRFDSIRSEHVVPAMHALLDELSAELERIETAGDPTWQDLVEPLERLGDRLGLAWGTVGHLMGVKNSEELRVAHGEAQPLVVAFSMRAAQSRPIYDRLRALKSGDGWSDLDPGQQRVVDNLLRDAELAGVGLDGSQRDRFNALELELAELQTRFSNNVLDATKAFALTLRDPADVAGLPPSLLELAAESARAAGEQGASAGSGPWRITLDQPCLVPFLDHCRKRDLRERLYRAYITRASSGPGDNTPLIDLILGARREQAQILGYASYAEMSLASKMAPDVGAVESLLEQLRSASYEAARSDLAELRTFAAAHDGDEAVGLAHWDVPFWSERMREQRFAYSDEELRPYFPLEHVLAGLFALASELFGVRVEAADGEVPVWHDDVRFFRIYEGEQPIAAFYLDPYSRPAEKRGGAWMDECVGRSRLMAQPGSKLRYPIAYLVCNQAPPSGGRPSMMSFEEVRTVFHEFGHGLQHMLTRVDYGLAAGIRGIEWDAVELASQFMENWCYQPDTLRGLSRHVETGKLLPEELFAKIQAARNYRAGSLMLRQVFLALTDLELHHHYIPDRGRTAFDVQRLVAETATVMTPLAGDRFLCSFSHIFAGGYGAGYYSYKWAEVLSADAFAAFEEAGLDSHEARQATGRRYRDTILALGGSRPPMEVFRAFRGREPSTEPLLRHSGLSD